MKTPRHAARLLPMAVALSLGATIVAGVPASAATAPVTPAPAKIRADFFGVHHGGAGADPVYGWPAAGTTGSIRLWDNGVSWREIETSQGVYDFSRLDSIITRARAKKARVLLVLGQTPNIPSYWKSSVPAAGTEYLGTGATTMPDKAAWRNYVVAVGNRYGRSIDYQVWNEANVPGFWTAGMGNLARLTKWTREAMNASKARGGRLVAPPFGTRSGISSVGSFYRQKPEGYAVAKFVDVVALQLYPTAFKRPEDSIALLNSAKRYLTKYKVNKPIYNTESNYGFQTGAQARTAIPISSTWQAGYASRTLVLNASNRISRVYWYRWDMKRDPVTRGAQGNTLMVTDNGYSLSAAGKAWKVTRGWLETMRPRGCTRARNGTYTCKFRYPTGKAMRHIIWNPGKNVTVKAPRYSTSYYKIDNVKRRAKTGTRIRVGVVPVMIRTSR